MPARRPGSGDQLLENLGATTRQNFTTVGRGHTGTETVHTLALQTAGLECTLHGAHRLIRNSERPTILGKARCAVKLIDREGFIPGFQGFPENIFIYKAIKIVY